MPKFHARRGEDGTSITYWDLESICHAEHDEPAGTLAITLVDGYELTLQGQEAADVVRFLHRHRFAPSEEPTHEEIETYERFLNRFLGGDQAESDRPAS